MATNEGEGGRRLNRMLQIVREEEEINRQLKALGMYDDNSTFEERKQILEAIKESEQLAATHSPLITGRSQSRVNGIQSRKSKNTPNSVFKKPFGMLSSDSENSDSADSDDDHTTFQPLKYGTLSEKPEVNFAADLAIPRSRLQVKLPSNIHTNRDNKTMLKNNGTRKKAESSIVLLEQVDPLESSEPKLEEIQKILLDTDSSDENPTFPEKPLKPVIIDGPTTSTVPNIPTKKSNVIQIKKSKLASMKSTAKKYSKLLTSIQKMTAEPLPDAFDFNITNSYQSLLAHEQSLRKAQFANTQPTKLSKPMNLSLLNAKKLQPSSKSMAINYPSPRTNTGTEVFELDPIFDSPSISHKQQMNSIIKSLESSSPIPRSVSLEPLVNSDEDFEYDLNPQHIPTSSEPETSRTKADTSDSSECPICNRPFPTSIIESHAAGCYNYLGDEEPKENLPRSTRSSVRQNHSELSRADIYVLPEGKARTTPTDEVDPCEMKYSDSDTEMEDPGANKRSRRRDMNRGKKRRF